jgi:hypothetical protein
MAETATELGHVTVGVRVEDQRLRVEALDFAIRSQELGEPPSTTVERADTYYEFLKGDK